jgi:hypothetical protein
VTSFESVSTWKQPEPPPAAETRIRLIRELATAVSSVSPGRLRVAIDGFTAAGKTSFGHELPVLCDAWAAQLCGLAWMTSRTHGARPENRGTTG